MSVCSVDTHTVWVCVWCLPLCLCLCAHWFNILPCVVTSKTKRIDPLLCRALQFGNALECKHTSSDKHTQTRGSSLHSLSITEHIPYNHITGFNRNMLVIVNMCLWVTEKCYLSFLSFPPFLYVSLFFALHVPITSSLSLGSFFLHFTALWFTGN